jgi:diguanylate cyclase
MKIIGCIAQEHDLRLVVIAALICATACFTTWNMLARAAVASGRARWAWIAGAAVAFGCGTWSTHFIAELAYSPSLPIAYAVAETLFSALVAIVGACLALFVFMGHPYRATNVLLGGVLLGATIGGMHYTGMAALRLPGTVEFQPTYVLASVLAGGVLATLGLATPGALTSVRRRVLGALLLLLAIVGLHFTAMAAVVLVPGPADSAPTTLLAPTTLAMLTATVSLAILSLSLLGSIVDQHLATRTAREARRLRHLVNAAFEGILIHRNGIVIDANDALAKLVRRPVSEVIGGRVLDFVAPNSVESTLHAMQTLKSTAIEISLRAADGTIRPVEILARADSDDLHEMDVLAIRDLSERKQAERQIRHLAHHDPLTGLPNRVLLQDRLKQALELAARGHGPVAMICLDLDRFKFVNDLLGHEGGDSLLIQVSDRLRAAVRSVDTVARLGGDEFAIIAPFAAHAENAVLAQRLVDSLAQPFLIMGQQVQVGTSVGVALAPCDGDAPDTLLRNADTALYRAKRDGRGRFCFFEPAMDLRLQERRALEIGLRQAVSRGELRLHYQPLCDCSSGEIEGFEALLRWTHPTHGSMSPDKFIPIAEESGLIVPIGLWVLETACAEATKWARSVRLAVNLSPVQFRQTDLAQQIADILTRSGLPPHRLELEVTESVLITEPGIALKTLNELKSFGIRLALDDFGTGYSSLHYLRSFPFDRLKLDKSFVGASEESDDAASIVRAVVSLGQSLRLSVTAEGVETEGQLALLRSLQCHQVQGFLFGRPIAAEEIGSMLTKPIAA